MPQQGAWHFADTPIGDPGDNRKEYIITLVAASPACNQALLVAPAIGGDYKMRNFPAGCHVVAQRVVFVTNG